MLKKGLDILSKVISCVNQKGGVGKTTTAVNLTAGLGKMGKKVLLIDIDPQGNSTSGYGINKRDLNKSSYNLLCEGAAISDVVVKTEFKGVDLVPANMNLVGAEIEMIEKDNRESVLKKAIAAVREKYDYIFLDCPPSLGLITLNALNASDTVLVPIQCEYFALEGLSQLMSTIRLVKQIQPHSEVLGSRRGYFRGYRPARVDVSGHRSSASCPILESPEALGGLIWEESGGLGS